MNKKLLTFIVVIFIVVVTVGGGVLYKNHIYDELKKKHEQIVSLIDEDNKNKDNYIGTTYNIENNTFRIMFKFENLEISNEQLFTDNFKERIRELCNMYKRRIKEDYDLDIDVVILINDYSIRSN